MINTVLIFAIANRVFGGLVPNPECPIPTQEVLDCGHPNITQEECLALGCCFNPTVVFVCYQKPVPKLPVGTIADPNGNPVNLDQNGNPQQMPDMIPEDPLVPQVFAEPIPTNTPETPTNSNSSTTFGPFWGFLVLALL